uniref:NAD(P)/FAD-dependent oxidoreductase n=1 Tax=Desulfatirhabdium butyrativorans TaxID=340467 RepID=A0A7C4MP04_9BACT
MTILIVGNGIAGNEVAFRLRSLVPDLPITLLSAESCAEYDPCSLPYYISGQWPRDVVFRRSIRDYEAKGIDLRCNQEAAAIDRSRKEVITRQGERFGYDKLILALGGSVFVPPIAGVHLDGVLKCKQLSDADALASRKGSRAVVIGSGAIGIEVAEALFKRGFSVTIIELMDWIAPVLFDAPTAERFEAAIRRYGIGVHTREKVLSIEGDGKVRAVRTDQREIPCDTVVLATGVVAHSTMAGDAGLAVGKGIVVNPFMQTSDPDIYACGDCVETVDACTGETAMYQLKHNALEQARIAALHIAGREVSYRGAYAFARLHCLDIHAVTFGKTQRSTACELGELEIIERESDTGDYLRIIARDGVVIGGQAIGAFGNDMGLWMTAMWRREPIRDIRNLPYRYWGRPVGAPWPHRCLSQWLSQP